jgi:hypothetical protein
MKKENYLALQVHFKISLMENKMFELTSRPIRENSEKFKHFGFFSFSLLLKCQKKKEKLEFSRP